MKDSWNREGVSWCSDDIRRELERTEPIGKKMAVQFLANKLILLAVTVVVLTFCLLRLQASVTLIAEALVLFLDIILMRGMERKAQAPIYQICDPYLQFSYIRAYGNFPFPRGQRTTNRQILSLAQCMTLAGQPEAAMAIQGQLHDPNYLKVGERTIYYNNLLLCFRQCGWMDRHQALMDELRRRRETAGRMEAMQLSVIFRMEEMKRRQEMGDIDCVEEYFRTYPPSYRFQAVGMHANLGMMYIKAGKAELARPHVEYVLDYGNKLYYKKQLEDYLRQSLEDDGPDNTPGGGPQDGQH